MYFPESVRGQGGCGALVKAASARTHVLQKDWRKVPNGEMCVCACTHKSQNRFP